MYVSENEQCIHLYIFKILTITFKYPQLVKFRKNSIVTQIKYYQLCIVLFEIP